ncbi:RluA family pseudouridine synthase [Bacillus dakarensis]|uniref:RluA family pseudouridine synthase n=1 Tax=Robertmurraya dakarensis TaxID=1926278 RepID=UPI001F2E51C2|nr:RluA family pseudouridine synthase [Bacillus dakarensis]
MMINFEKKGEWLVMSIPPVWEGLTPEQLFQEVWKAPKKQTHFIRMNKEMLINGKSDLWTHNLTKGDCIRLKLFQEEDFGVTPSYMDVDILFEDELMLVVNKPPGIDTHPNSPGQTNTIANGIAFYLQANGEHCPVKHIHRLDRDTSGVILFAKNSFAGAILDRMLQERNIKRTYTAIVHGIMQKKKGKIDAPIGRDRHHPTRRRVSPNGQKAVTRFEVTETNKKNNTTIVRCQLDTGRTHQIRVHFSHIGHPLVGDLLYGGKPSYHRQALHAAKLEFVHPFTLEKLSISAPHPW